MKQVVVVFEFPGATLEQYDGVWNDLRKSGVSSPKGLISHVGAMKPNGELLVVDIWESEQAFKDFGNILMPLIAKNQLPVTSTPLILPAHFVLLEEKQKMHAG